MSVRGAWIAGCLALLGCGAEVDERPASWSYIHAAIIVPNCATSSCHSALARNKGLSFQDRDEARDNFIGWPVDPSLLRVGLIFRMPPDQPLPEADIQLIERWIAAGRPDN